MTSTPETITTTAPVILPAGYIAASATFRFNANDLIDETTGEPKLNEKGEKIRVRVPSKTLLIPQITMEGMIESLSRDAKVRDYLLGMANASIKSAIRSALSDEDNLIKTQEDLDCNAFTLEALASMPASERRGRGISKEAWAEFFEDYKAVMTTLAKLKPETVEKAVAIMKLRMQPVRFRPALLNAMQMRLTQYASLTERLDDFVDQVSFLNEKIVTFLETKDDDSAEML